MNCEQDCEYCERLPQCGMQPAFDYRLTQVKEMTPEPPVTGATWNSVEKSHVLNTVDSLVRRVGLLENIIVEQADVVMRKEEL